MELPLYFVFSGNYEKAPSNEPIARYYLPGEDTQDADIVIIPDTPLGKSTDEFVKSVYSSARDGNIRGIFFDFERPLNGEYVRLAEEIMQKLPDCFFLLPEHYAAISETALILCTPAAPQNCWQAFCEQKQRLYENRWALEQIPYQLLYEDGKKQSLPYRTLQQLKTGDGQYLAQAVCISQRSERQHLIYDTAHTLRKKMEIAESYGCRLSLGLWEELQYYF